jgi:hypothetical protein
VDGYKLARHAHVIMASTFLSSGSILMKAGPQTRH